MGGYRRTESINTVFRGRSQGETLVAVLAVIGLSQNPQDKVLWELTNHGGKLKKSELRRRTRLKLSELEPILEELTREGKIRISKEIISIL